MAPTLSDFLDNFMDLANVIANFDNIMAKFICKQIADMFTLINEMLKSTLDILTQDIFNSPNYVSIQYFVDNAKEIFMAFGFALSAVYFLIGFYQDILDRKGHCDFQFIIFSFLKLGIAQQVIKQSGEIFTYISKICNSIATQLGAIPSIQPKAGINYKALYNELKEKSIFEMDMIQGELMIIKILIYLLYLVIIVSIYYRALMIFVYKTIAPIALAGISGRNGLASCKPFIKHYATMCAQGAAIIFSFVLYKYVLMDFISLSIGTIELMWKIVVSTAILVVLVLGSQSLASKAIPA